MKYHSKQKAFGIVAGTLTGNRGAEAMVTTCMQEIHSKYPDAIVHVFTYYPEQDTKEAVPTNVFVHSCTPVQLVTNWFILSLLAKIFPFLKNQKCKNGLGILSFLELDAVLDVAGVSFIDGREKFLPFNVLTLFPFLLHKVPVFKMSQAIGPITSIPNRLFSSWVLPKLSYIFARGKKTLGFVQAFLKNHEKLRYAPDISFLLKADQQVAFEKRPEKIGIIPSSLVFKKRPDYAAKLATFIESVQKRGIEVEMIVHSWRAQTNHPRNNDIVVAKQVNQSLETPVQIVGEGLSAKEIKSRISTCKMVVTSRFHGMIAALSTQTPVLVIGWSHKYREVLQEFGFVDHAIDYKQMDVDQLVQKTLQIYGHSVDDNQQIQKCLPTIKQDVEKQFEIVFKQI